MGESGRQRSGVHEVSIQSPLRRLASLPVRVASQTIDSNASFVREANPGPSPISINVAVHYEDGVHKSTRFTDSRSLSPSQKKLLPPVSRTSPEVAASLSLLKKKIKQKANSGTKGTLLLPKTRILTPKKPHLGEMLENALPASPLVRDELVLEHVASARTSNAVGGSEIAEDGNDDAGEGEVRNSKETETLQGEEGNGTETRDDKTVEESGKKEQARELKVPEEEDLPEEEQQRRRRHIHFQDNQVERELEKDAQEKEQAQDSEGGAPKRSTANPFAQAPGPGGGMSKWSRLKGKAKTIIKLSKLSPMQKMKARKTANVQALAFIQKLQESFEGSE